MASILKASRHVAMWSVGAGTAIPLILPSVLAEDKPVSGPCCQGKIKPSQLPIYDEPEDLYDITYYVSGKGQLQEGVEAVRKELEEALDSTKERRDQVDHIYQTGKAHTAALLYDLMEKDLPVDRQIAYLRDEENLPARVGAITAGGLVGLLFGARGRILKKLLYTSVGAGATGAVLYPEYCKLYSQDLWHNANTYATVAYNFFVGVKPQVNGSGSGSQETAAISPVDSGKSKSLDAIGVEVSNPYPSLLTLPYTTLFRKQESLSLLSREKSMKVVYKAGPSDASLDRMAEDASQVSMLGSRLLESEKQVTGRALSGFGSVAQEDSDNCKKCGKKRRVHKRFENHEVTKLSSISPCMDDFIPLSVPVVENYKETSKKGIVDKIESVSKEAAKFIDELRTGTEFVAEVSDKVIVGAETVQKVLEAVETAANLAPVVGVEVALATECVAGEVGILVDVASEVKQVAETTETALETVEKMAENIESLAGKVSHLDGDLQTAKETNVETPKKGTMEELLTVAGEVSKVVGVIKTGMDFVAKTSDEVEAGSEMAEKFAETLEKSERLPQVVGAGVVIVAKEAALVAGIAGEVHQATEKLENVLDSLTDVAEKVETLVEKVSVHEEPVPAAAGKDVILQSETNVVSIADAQDEANSLRSLFDKLTSLFSSKNATESVPSNFINSLATQQLKTDQRSSDVASDSKNITPSQGPTSDTNTNEYVEPTIETPIDIDASKTPPIDENHATHQGETLNDKHVNKLDIVQATKDEEILAAEILNTDDTKVEPDVAMAPGITSASPEKTVDTGTSSGKTQDSDKLVDQSKIDTKIETLKDAGNDQQNAQSEVAEFPKEKSLFGSLSELFGIKKPERAPQNNTQVSPVLDSSEVAASGGPKPKVDFSEPEVENNQSPIATPILDYFSQKNSDAPPHQSQSRVLPTPNSGTAQKSVNEALSATPPLETSASPSEIVQKLTTQTEPTIPVTEASQKTALPETVVTGKTALPDTIVTKDAALPEAVAAQETALSTKVATQETAIPTTVTTQETARPSTVTTLETALPTTVTTQKTALPEIVVVQKTALPENVCQETVTQEPAFPETVALDNTLSKIVSQEPTAVQAIPVTKATKSPVVVATTTHADPAAALPQRPGVTITQSEENVIVSSDASNLVLPAEPDASDPVIVAPLVRQLDGYTIVEAPGTTEDIAYTLEDDEAAADFEATETNKSAGTSVSSEPGLYSYTNDTSKINQPTSAESKLLAPSANIVSQSTMSDDKNRGDSTDKKAPQVAEKVKDVVVRAEADKKKGAGETKLEVDHGQSNPEDADMYTTRS